MMGRELSHDKDDGGQINIVKNILKNSIKLNLISAGEHQLFGMEPFKKGIEIPITKGKNNLYSCRD